MASFRLEDVTRTFHGRPAVSGVSVTFTPGEHTAIIGRSGSGKTTLLRLVAGLDAPSSGKIFLGDEAVSLPGRVVRPPHRRGLSMVFQDLALWPNLSVVGNVLLGLSGTGLSRVEARKRALETLALCSIESLANRRPGELSGGEQQRVALARALAVRPAFLLMDEPFSELDLVTKSDLLEQILALVNEREVTLLLVTHDPGEAVHLCRSAVVLDDGLVEESGSLEELLRAPRSRILRVFTRTR